jgi:hypothetical protein
MPKRKRKKLFPLPAPQPSADHGRLLRVLAKLLRQIADELTRIADG